LGTQNSSPTHCNINFELKVDFAFVPAFILYENNCI
jgi:hypothetical protein